MTQPIYTVTIYPSVNHPDIYARVRVYAGESLECTEEINCSDQFSLKHATDDLEARGYTRNGHARTL
jgi:hypothetical protein